MELLKIDLSKTDPYYKARPEPEIKDLDTYYFLTVEGQSAPENQKFTMAMTAIYAIAYGIKFLCKAEDNDFTIPKMECIWYIDGGMEVQHQFVNTPRYEWKWKIAIRMPDVVESTHFFRTVQNIRRKKPQLASLEKVNFELINEGRCVQMLHHGSYEEEGPTIQKIAAFISEKGMKITGYHKEIYLSDPRKVAPQKLKTIIRYPVNQKQ